MVTMFTVMVGVILAGAIAGGLMLVWHLLKKKEAADTIEAIKTQVIPELEKMTTRMLENSMDMVFEKSVEMTKKMTESMYSE